MKKLLIASLLLLTAGCATTVAKQDRFDDVRVNGELTFGTSANFTLPDNAASTAEGNTTWNATADRLYIGDGAAAHEFVDLTSTQALSGKTITFPDGSSGAPTVKFASGTTTGLWLPANNILGIEADQIQLKTNGEILMGTTNALADSNGAEIFNFSGTATSGTSNLSIGAGLDIGGGLYANWNDTADLVEFWNGTPSIIGASSTGYYLQPGSDIDHIIFSSDVTGFPGLVWDESETDYDLTAGLDVTGAITATTSITATGAGSFNGLTVTLDAGGILFGSGDDDKVMLYPNVTGAPEFGWDESEDQFDLNKGLIVTGPIESTVPIQVLSSVDGSVLFGSNSTTAVANGANWDAFTLNMQNNSSCVLDIQIWCTDTDEGADYFKYHIYQGTGATQTVDVVLSNIHEAPTFTVSQIQVDNGTDVSNTWRMGNASGGTLDFNAWIKVTSPIISDITVTF